MTHVAGSLLLNAGLITRDDLVRAETLRQREGGSLGESLVRLGALSEDQLVDFYHRRLLVPRIGHEQFAHVAPRVVRALPGDMAAEFRVFPIDIDGEGTITLAMADPANTHVVDELSFFTERFLQRAVAAESLIKQAITRYYGVQFEVLPALAAVSRSRPKRGPTEPTITDGDAAEPVMLLTAAKIVKKPSAAPVESEAVVLLTPASIVQKAAPPADDVEPVLLLTPAAIVAQPRRPVDEPEPILLLTKVKRADEAPTEERQRVPTPKGIGVVALPLAPPTVVAPPAPSTPILPAIAPVAEPTLVNAISPLPVEDTPTEDAASERAAAVPGATDATMVTPAPLVIEATKSPSKRRSITLTGIGKRTGAATDPPLESLRAAESREEVASIVLDYVMRIAPRVILFVMRKGELIGQDARAEDLDETAVRRLVLAVDSASVFSDAIRSRLPYRGPMPDGPANQRLTRLIGERAGEVLLLPIALRERVIAVVYADGINSPLPDAALHALSRSAGRAYERLILSGKR